MDTLANALSHFSDSIKRFEKLLANKAVVSKITAEDWDTLVKLEQCITEVSF